MNDTSIPLLSIIVPTKNREDYAFFVVKQVLSFNYDNIQIVIQNNSDTNKLKDMLSQFSNDKRLIYNYCEKNISTIENFNNAIENSTGEYLCSIGDDDGINPEIMKLVSWAKINNVDAIKSGLEAHYFWPDSGVTHEPSLPDNGVLMIMNIYSSIIIDDPRKELRRLMNDGCQNYYERNLVKIYHGIVKRSCMETVKKTAGNYFGGLSPDIFSVVALSTDINKIVSIEYPLTIPGVCKKSTSADSSTGKHTGKLKDAPHFNGHENYKWAEEVPEFYSVYTIWADSALAAVRDMKNKKLLSEFNVACSSARLILRFPGFFNIILNHYLQLMGNRNKSKFIAIINLFLYLIKIAIIYSIRKIKRTIFKEKVKNTYIGNVSNIIDAENELHKFLEKNNMNIDKVIEKLNILYNLQ